MTGGGSCSKCIEGNCENHINGGGKVEINLEYKNKYLKYKAKYLNLVNQSN